MILADKVINERKRNGWSQEDLAEQLGVSRQSVSKWEGAQAVPDLQKILKMAEIFGVSTDYLLKDEMDAPECQAQLREDSDNIPPLRKVSMEEANEYLNTKRSEAPKIALGTALCITCAVPLIFLAGLSEGMHVLSENAASAIGVLWIFVQIAIGVFLFITSGKRLEKFEYVEKENFETEYGVSGMVKEKLNAFSDKKTQMTTLAVLMCILCPIPILITAFAGMSDFVIVCAVCLLLIIVAVAVYIFTYFSMIEGSYKSLLQEGEYTKKGKSNSKKLRPISGIYWGICTAIFLGISFIGNDWGRSWIVWPIAGVLYAAVLGIVKLVLKIEE